MFTATEGALDFWSYSVLGMYEEEFSDKVDSLHRRSLIEPVSRNEVTALLDEYNVRLSDLPTVIKWKIGDIEVCD